MKLHFDANINYQINLYWSNDDDAFVAEVPELPFLDAWLMEIRKKPLLGTSIKRWLYGFVIMHLTKCNL